MNTKNLLKLLAVEIGKERDRASYPSADTMQMLSSLRRALKETSDALPDEPDTVPRAEHDELRRLAEGMAEALQDQGNRCPDCGGSGIYSPLGDGDECERCKPLTDALAAFRSRFPMQEQGGD